MPYDYGATQAGDWLEGKQYDENGRAIAFDPSHMNTIGGQTQQLNYGDYLTGLMNQGIISPTDLRTGSGVYGRDPVIFNGKDGNLYETGFNGAIAQVPMSNFGANGKAKQDSTYNFLDPKTGAVTSGGKMDYTEDGGGMLALAMIAAMTGGAASAGIGAAAGASAGGAGGGAAGGAGGFLGEGAASGIGAWDGALAAAPSWTAPAAAGAAGGAFNPAMDSQLANTQLGLTAADTSSATIPSVTVNGAPSSMWSSLFPNNGTDTISSPWEKLGQTAMKKAGTSLLNKGISSLAGGTGGSGSPGGASLSLPQSGGPSTSVAPAPGYYSIASTPKNPYTLGLMRGSNGN